MRIIAALCLPLLTALALIAASHAAESPPEEFGRVLINNHSQRSGVSAVVFDHWLHRSKFTCRLCHVDIGFEMREGATGITKQSNSEGFYCGSCHDGERVIDGVKMFRSCSDTFKREDYKTCVLCHSADRDVEKKYEFHSYTKSFPKGGLGNGIDWEEAEARGLIKPIDYIEGVSIKRPPLKSQEDFSIRSKGTWMTDVIFSHKKHAVWNGCEVCHPHIFPSVEKGSVKFSMLDIYNGEYCGVCHNYVAFPLRECDRCHTKPVGDMP